MMFRNKLTTENAKTFYAEHQDKPFFPKLVDFMASADSIFLLIDGKDSIAKWREIIGATNPQDRNPDCLRAKFGDPFDVTFNGFHGSDSQESAMREARFLFGDR